MQKSQNLNLDTLFGWQVTVAASLEYFKLRYSQSNMHGSYNEHGRYSYNQCIYSIWKTLVGLFLVYS